MISEVTVDASASMTMIPFRLTGIGESKSMENHTERPTYTFTHINNCRQGWIEITIHFTSLRNIDCLLKWIPVRIVCELYSIMLSGKRKIKHEVIFICKGSVYTSLVYVKECLLKTLVCESLDFKVDHGGARPMSLASPTVEEVTTRFSTFLTPSLSCFSLSFLRRTMAATRQIHSKYQTKNDPHQSHYNSLHSFGWRTGEGNECLRWSWWNRRLAWEKEITNLSNTRFFAKLLLLAGNYRHKSLFSATYNPGHRNRKEKRRQRVSLLSLEQKTLGRTRALLQRNILRSFLLLVEKGLWYRI